MVCGFWKKRILVPLFQSKTKKVTRKARRNAFGIANQNHSLREKVVGERAFLVDGKVKYPIEVCSTPVMVTSLK